MAPGSAAAIAERLRARLDVLEQQRAGFGELYAPPHIITQIDAIKRELALLAAQPDEATVAAIAGRLDAAEGTAPQAPTAPDAPPLPDTPPLRMLALLAAPLVARSAGGEQPVAPLALQEEISAIVAACKQIDPPVALELRVEVATAGAIGHIFATVRGGAFDILHFSGHGSVDVRGTVLVLEDEYEPGLAREMGAGELAQLLGATPCRLAVLSACHSAGLADTLLALGVPHVVAIAADEAVLDLAARSFAQRFYPALLAGHPVADAFEKAKRAVGSDDKLRTMPDPAGWRTAAVAEAPKFRLLPENDSAHEQPLVASPPPGTVRAPAHAWQRTNLAPVAADPFAGRRRELQAIVRMLRDPLRRCVALNGPGGMGKTALAEAAGRWQHERSRWPNGVWLAELRSVSTAAQARATIALALGLPPEAGATDAALAAALRDWQALLILDDLDDLREADAAGLAGLLRALLGQRGLHLLATGRRALPGQVTHQPYELRRLAAEDALVAFRAYAPPPDEWGAWTRNDLDALLGFLDGYPFPIRLAATYLERTRCGLAELRHALEANPHGTLRYPGDDEDRTSSLAATLDLSFRALPATAQGALPLLALFPAGLSRAAARAILGEDSLGALETLRMHSMAEWRDEAGGGRFALPEPARRYAEAKQPPEAFAQLAPAALAFFHALVDTANDQIIAGDIPGGRALLTLEMPNLRRVLDWGYASEQRDDGMSLSARVTGSLKNYWTVISAWATDEVRHWLERARAAAQRCQDQRGEANVLKALGDLLQFRKQTDAALDSYQQALALFRAVGDRLGEANVLAAHSRLMIDTDPPRSQELLEAALALRRAISNVYSEAADLGNYGIALLRRGRNAEALPYLQRARALFAERGIAHLVEYMDSLIAQAEEAEGADT